MKIVGGVIRKQNPKIVKKCYNYINIWCTVTSKQYALYHLLIKLYTKFQHDPVKTVGGVIRKRNADEWTDGQTDTGWYTIIPRDYRVAGYNEDFGYRNNPKYWKRLT